MSFQPFFPHPTILEHQEPDMNITLEYIFGNFCSVQMPLVSPFMKSRFAKHNEFFSVEMGNEEIRRVIFTLENLMYT